MLKGTKRPTRVSSPGIMILTNAATEMAIRRCNLSRKLPNFISAEPGIKTRKSANKMVCECPQCDADLRRWERSFLRFCSAQVANAACTVNSSTLTLASPSYTYPAGGGGSGVTVTFTASYNTTATGGGCLDETVTITPSSTGGSFTGSTCSSIALNSIPNGIRRSQRRSAPRLGQSRQARPPRIRSAPRRPLRRSRHSI